MAAQFRRPAQLNGAHHASFDAAEMAVMSPAIGVAVAAEDIRHFQSRGHDPPDQAGGTISSVSRSSGLSVRRMSSFETRV